MDTTRRASREQHEQLCRMIQRWNEHRVELFEITMPNENLEFEGIMRFYFQSLGDDGQKVATKCIRVSNTATTDMVIDALIQKFRPDLRMLTSHSSYSLYEVHSDMAGERRISRDECPLLVQLDWVAGDREGRFLLRQEANEINPKALSRAEKRAQKEQAKKEKKASKKRKSVKKVGGVSAPAQEEETEEGTIAHSLYQDMPESRFTRSISVKNRRNQVVMKGDRKRLSLPRDDFDDGSVPVYADTVLPDVPCKSLLISNKDTAAQVVKSALDKYGLREDPTHFCLVQVTVPPMSHVSSDAQMNGEYNERILNDQELPLLINHDLAAMGNHMNGGMVQFQLRRRSSFTHRRSHSHSPEDDPTLPVLIEIFEGAQSPPRNRRKFFLSPELTEIGSNVNILDSKSYLCLTSPGIMLRHCAISSIGGIFIITPLDKQAMIQVNHKVVKEPQQLPHNAVVVLGDCEIFRFFAPVEMKSSSASTRTLPMNIGRSGANRHDRRSENMSKAYSVEDILNSGLGHGGVRVLKDRAMSEYNLNADGVGYPDSRRKFSEPSKGAASLGGAKHGDIFTGSPTKRLHYSIQGSEQEGLEPEWVLPATLSFYQAKENLLLQSMISDVNGYLLQFKLAPSYGLYMVAKHHLASDFQPGMSNSERRKCLLLTLKSIISQIKRAVKESRNIAGALAFWLANTSEFLQFMKRDYQLNRYTGDYEVALTQTVHTAYKHFTQCMLKELSMFLPAFHDDSNEADSEEGYISGGEGNGIGKEPDVIPVPRPPTLSRQTSITGMYWSVAGSKIRRRGRPTIGDVLTTLSSTVSLLKRCRVNATLSVMIFSLLFRYISTKLFNKLVSDGKFCSRSIGQKLRKRLDRIKVWAEREGMELPAENHLSMVEQAANLLQAAKKLPEEAQAIFATCPKLNSRQIDTLLHHCSLSEGDMAVNQAFAKELILLAQAHTDEALKNDGMEINLEEDPNLELPFLVPQQGYSCDTIRGMPPGLQDYMEPMISAGLCKLTISKESSGFWAPPAKVATSTQSLDQSMSPPTYGESNPNVMSNTLPRMIHRHSEPEARGISTLPRHLEHMEHPSDMTIPVIQVTITKEHTTLGISIVGGKNSVGPGDLGIFIKSMVEGGAAYLDGRLKPGDQILQVDSYNLEGCTQEQAAMVLRGTGKAVTLTVAKQAAAHYGLYNLLCQASPRYNRKYDPQIPEGSSHARKAQRRQKREQREREREKERERERERERQRPQQHEFRLERRKLDHQPEPNHFPPPNLPEARFPPNTNPQFAKWIMEHNVYYNQERDIQGSMSSLTNIPERERAGSPVPSYTTTSTRPRRDSNDRGLYRPPTPPVRDTGPSRPSDYPPSYSNFDGMDTLDSHTVSETPTKFSEFPEPDHQFPTTPLSGTPYKVADFSSLSSQPTLSSQQVLTPFSQHQNPSQHQHHRQQQQLDKLSMDVLYHTQLSGASVAGIASMVPKLDAKPSTFLDREVLKELDMDEIDLIKQKIKLMQKEAEKQQQEGRPSADPPGGEEDDDVFPEQDQHVLQLRQELESLEQLVSDQKKKYKEIKMAREREEQNVKHREQELMNGPSMVGLNPNDQHRWQREQKKRLRELERIRTEQSEHLRQFEYDERCAKTKLKAYDAQAAEIRQQLHSTGHHPEMLPSKLPSGHRGRLGGSISGSHRDMTHLPQQTNGLRSRTMKSVDDSSHMAVVPAEQEWTDTSRSISSRVMSMESMTTSTWIAPEQPDIAKEMATTMSDLSEPTQNDYVPSKLVGGRGSSSRSSHELPSPVPNASLYGMQSHSRTTLDEGQFSQDERLKQLREEHLSSREPVLPKSSEARDFHLAQLQQERFYHETRQQQQRRQSAPQTGTTREVPDPPTSNNDLRQQTYKGHQAWNSHHGMPPYGSRLQPVGGGGGGDHYHPKSGHHRGSLPTGGSYGIDNLHNIAEHPVQDTSRVPTTPDVVPGPISPRAVLNGHRQPSVQRSTSPLAGKYSDHSTGPRSPSYGPVYPQRDAERPHPSPSVTSPKPEYDMAVRSLMDKSKPTSSAFTSPRHLPPQSRPNHDITAAKMVHSRSHDLRNPGHTKTAPERDTNYHVKPNIHRYGALRPDNKTGSHSYSRGRPEMVNQQMTTANYYMEKSFKNPPPRHPERLQRQQTEL